MSIHISVNYLGDEDVEVFSEESESFKPDVALAILKRLKAVEPQVNWKKIKITAKKVEE